MTTKEMDEFNQIIEGELSGNEDVLRLIEPGNKRKYGLSTNEPGQLKKGIFNRGHIKTGSEIKAFCPS